MPMMLGPNPFEPPPFDTARPEPSVGDRTAIEALGVGGGTLVVLLSLLMPWYSFRPTAFADAPTFSYSALGQAGGGWRFTLVGLGCAALVALAWSLLTSTHRQAKRAVVSVLLLGNLVGVIAAAIDNPFRPFQDPAIHVSLAWGAYLSIVAGSLALLTYLVSWLTLRTG
jgi:hypothetical protein